MRALSVVLGDYPHTRPLKAGEIAIDGVDCSFPRMAPLHGAFARMVRELEFDVCEMALATFLQARDAGIPVTLLPLVMVGGTHHKSLTRWPGSDPLAPEDLIGRRVGVRAYSQTTGVWVRGILREEFGIDAADITWVTTEECHVAQYKEPDNVVRTEGGVVGLLRDRRVDAAVLGPRALADQGIELVPVIAAADAAAAAWMQRHGTIPVNHMVVVRSRLLDSDTDAISAVYGALVEAIQLTSGERDASPAGRVIAAGWTETLLRSLEVATRYCVEQRLLTAPVDWGALRSEARMVTG